MFRASLTLHFDSCRSDVLPERKQGQQEGGLPQEHSNSEPVRLGTGFVCVPEDPVQLGWNHSMPLGWRKLKILH